MKATEVLMEEHRAIERMLSVVEQAAWRLEQGQPVPPNIFGDAADFFSGFADRCHHTKEEQHLFPTLAQRGIPTQGGPIGVMLAEHDQGRAYLRTMREEARQYAAGAASDPQKLLAAVRGYVALLRQHIQKEDQVLFRMADRVLDDADQRSLVEAFEAVERDVLGVGEHEHYHAMLEAMDPPMRP